MPKTSNPESKKHKKCDWCEQHALWHVQKTLGRLVLVLADVDDQISNLVDELGELHPQ